MPISSTIDQFREDVLKKGGPQISGMYEVLLQKNNGTSIFCYPMTVIFPGRMFSFYEHDIWGPNRKVPFKRGYTQCHMTFIVYQDWAERNFIEGWMNTVIFNGGVYKDYVNYANGTGRIQILCTDSEKTKFTKEVILKEAYPAAISQMNLTSDGSGFPTFTVTFQFNEYEYKDPE